MILMAFIHGHINNWLEQNYEQELETHSHFVQINFRPYQMGHLSQNSP